LPRISRIGTDKPFLEKPLLISLFLIFFLDPCFFDPQDPCVFQAAWLADWARLGREILYRGFRGSARIKPFF